MNDHNIFFRSVITWLLFIPIVFINATIRELVYKPLTGELAAHQISTVIASATFFILAYFHLRNYLQTVSNSSLFQIGFMWVIMTVPFEFALGRIVTGASWDKLLFDYNILEGRIWIMLLIAELATPFGIKQLKNLKTKRYESAY